MYINSIQVFEIWESTEDLLISNLGELIEPLYYENPPINCSPTQINVVSLTLTWTGNFYNNSINYMWDAVNKIDGTTHFSFTEEVFPNECLIIPVYDNFFKKGPKKEKREKPAI